MAWQAQLDSLAAVEAYKQDSIRAAYLAEHPEDTVVAALPVQAAVYSDSLLNAAANRAAMAGVSFQGEVSGMAAVHSVGSMALEVFWSKPPIIHR